jgi:hypothetical protein
LRQWSLAVRIETPGLADQLEWGMKRGREDEEGEADDDELEWNQFAVTRDDEAENAAPLGPDELSGSKSWAEGTENKRKSE